MTDESVETQSKKNAAKVGLVVVHGIGNQKHGKLAFKIAKSLVAEEEGTGEQLIKPSKSGASPMSILAGNIKILVDEAYWASLSHPDNRPRVILAKDLVSDYFQLITSAWNNSEISRAFRGNSFNRIKNMSMVSLGIIGLILSLFASMIFSEPSEPNIWFTAAIAAAIFSYVFFHTKRSLRYRWLRDRHLNLYKRISLFILWMPLAYFSSFLYLIAPILIAEILLFYSLLVISVLLIGYLGVAFIVPFQLIGEFLRKINMMWLRKWSNRLGSIFVVLPAHTAQQLVKATGQLISVALSESGWTRLVATVGIPGVFFGFSILFILCELLYLPILYVVFLPNAAQNAQINMGTTIVEYFFLVLLYAAVVKSLLWLIDLVLDISNYHLASMSERKVYFNRLTESVNRLKELECEKIHILAHSLGSIITYDWLRSQSHNQSLISSFYTIGSPLDKFWYIDHSQQQRQKDSGGLSSKVVKHWLNFYAFSDPVSGNLNHYGGGKIQPVNIRLRWLGFYLYSHVRYWKSKYVLEMVKNKITSMTD